MRISKWSLVIGLSAAMALCLLPPAIAKPTSSGAAGSSSPPQSATAAGPPAPLSPLPATFATFYILAPGSDPNFSTYVTELAARYIGNDFHPPVAPVNNSKLPLFFVAVPSWTEDTFNSACQVDPNIKGGLMIEYSNFSVESNWLVYNTESEHVTPILTMLDCHLKQARLLTPPLKLFTVKSKNETTIPIAPITAIGSLFTFRGSSTPNAYVIGVDELLIPTFASGFSGNVGYLNQGHEALSAATQVARDANDFVKLVCRGTIPPSSDSDLTPAGQDSAIRQSQLDALRALRQSKDVDQLALGTPTIASSGTPITSTVIIAQADTKARNLYAPQVISTMQPTPTPSPTPSVSSLTRVCEDIEPY